jgi:hypothetical protein
MKQLAAQDVIPEWLYRESILNSAFGKAHGFPLSRE